MYTALSPGAIGVWVGNLEGAIAVARKGGFEGLEFSAGEVAALVEERGVDEVRALFSRAGLRPAGWPMPVDWRGSKEAWRAGLEELPRLAKAASSIGATRTFTYVLPGSNERPYEENRRFHMERFAPIAGTLAEHGCRLGLEFIGPKTMRDGFRHLFIHTMGDMLEMGREIAPNVGLLLDCWHWYTSGGTIEELGTLRPEQVVYAHVNDAPAGIPVDEQLDDVRALPGETGVIDIAGFLGMLREIDYDGPVVPEPFKRELAELPTDEERIETVGASMDIIFRQSGLRVPRHEIRVATQSG